MQAVLFRSQTDLDDGDHGGDGDGDGDGDHGGDGDGDGDGNHGGDNDTQHLFGCALTAAATGLFLPESFPPETFSTFTFHIPSLGSTPEKSKNILTHQPHLDRI